MKKIILSIFSLLVIYFFLVSCAPRITDEELETELAKLTPEEREELLADLKAKESGAFAGQAVKITEKEYYGKVSPKVLKAPSKQIKIISEVLETPSAKATLFCNVPENVGKYTHYCSETGTEIKYDKFKCVEYPAKIYAVHKLDTTYPKDKLYPQVDTCKEILATFLDQKDYGTIGCYDSDSNEEGVNSLLKVGYIEVYTIQTGNKAPGAYSDTSPIKEVDACSGLYVKSGNYPKGSNLQGDIVGCNAGYYGEGLPPSGYTGETTTCVFKWRLSDQFKYHQFQAYGNRLFERTCPSLFSTQAEDMSVIIDNCPYVTGYQCIAGKCDSTVPANYIPMVIIPGESKSEPCEQNKKCKNAGNEVYLNNWLGLEK